MNSMKVNLAKFPYDATVKCKCGEVAEYSFSEFNKLDQEPLIVCEEHIPQAWKEASGK